MAIIRVDMDDGVRYLVQVKSHDYPVEIFRGTACLLGGNAQPSDAAPLDTLLRELNEELGDPKWVGAIDPGAVVDDSASAVGEPPFNSSAVGPPAPGTVRYLGATLHFQSASLLGRDAPYAFLCALYKITIRPDQLPPKALYPRGANIREGRVALLSEDQLLRHSKYAWGYEYTMDRYFGGRTANKQSGTAVTEVDKQTWRETTWAPLK